MKTGFVFRKLNELSADWPCFNLMDIHNCSSHLRGGRKVELLYTWMCLDPAWSTIQASSGRSAWLKWFAYGCFIIVEFENILILFLSAIVAKSHLSQGYNNIFPLALCLLFKVSPMVFSSLQCFGNSPIIVHTNISNFNVWFTLEVLHWHPLHREEKWSCSGNVL